MALYNPPHFREDDVALQHELITASPFGLLISAEAEQPCATPLPLILLPTVGLLGTLQGHLAKANDHWRSLEGRPVLVVFQGADAYISPTWYASKREHGKVVPTWNYATVHVRGTARVVHDGEWLREHVGRLTESQERSREVPWAIGDAPSTYIEGQLKGIVGIEIEIRALEGKWKVSQNRSAEDQRGVIAGLASQGDEAMASLVKGKLKS